MRKLVLLFFLAPPALAQSWRFSVAGDSRNCGDVVMPAIAAASKAAGAAFYWHLGDFRRGGKADEDMARPSEKSLSESEYAAVEWSDFITHQLRPFGGIPVFLAIGNHELNGHARSEYITRFGEWVARPEIVAQRLADDANDRTVRTWYHWIENGVDFITLDNASRDMFDEPQMRWLDRVLARDAADAAVKSVVVGMHAALPHGLACDHSMNDSSHGETTGSRVYQGLLRFRKSTGKNVYVIASHAHLWLRDVYDTPYWRAHGGVLPGLIIGTAGAARYRLPDLAAGFPPDRAKTDTYGWVLATVAADGAITFEYRELKRSDIPSAVVSSEGADTVAWCFAENKDLKPRVSAPCAAAEAPSPAVE
jgi:calcineurin-like phosphoesterase family protein